MEWLSVYNISTIGKQNKGEVNKCCTRHCRETRGSWTGEGGSHPEHQNTDGEKPQAFRGRAVFPQIWNVFWELALQLTCETILLVWRNGELMDWCLELRSDGIFSQFTLIGCFWHFIFFPITVVG